MGSSYGSLTLMFMACSLLLFGSVKCISLAKLSENNTGAIRSTPAASPSTEGANVVSDIKPRVPTSTSTSKSPTSKPSLTMGSDLDTKKSEHWTNVFAEHSWVLILGGVAMMVLLVSVVVLSVVVIVLCRKMKTLKGYNPHKGTKSYRNRPPIPLPPDSPSEATAITQIDSPTTTTPPPTKIESLKYDLPFTTPVKIAKSEKKKWAKPEPKAKPPKPPARKAELPVDKDDYILPRTALESPTSSPIKKTVPDEAQPKLDDANYLIITHSDSGKKDSDNNNKTAVNQQDTEYKVPKGEHKNLKQEKPEIKVSQIDMKKSLLGYDVPHGKKITKSLSQGDLYKVPKTKKALTPEGSGYVSMDMYKVPRTGNSSGHSSASDVSYDVPNIGKDQLKPLISASQECLTSQGYDVPKHHDDGDDERCYVNHRPVVFR